MSTLIVNPPLTNADLDAMPADGMERWLIRGELREKPMTKRNRFHAGIETNIAHLFREWLILQPKPRGRAYSGEVGCILREDPETTFGIDVAYFSAEVVAAQTDDTTLIRGVPTIAVEILSPNDTVQEVDEKVAEYLEAGVPHVWIVNTRHQAITVYKPDALPVLRNLTDTLDAEPQLTGFRIPVARIFEE